MRHDASVYSHRACCPPRNPPEPTTRRRLRRTPHVAASSIFERPISLVTFLPPTLSGERAARRSARVRAQYLPIALISRISPHDYSVLNRNILDLRLAALEIQVNQIEARGSDGLRTPRMPHQVSHRIATNEDSMVSHIMNPGNFLHGRTLQYLLL